MRSGRLLVFDFALVGVLSILLFALAVGVRRRLRRQQDPTAVPTLIAASVGLIIIGINYHSGIRDAVSGSNWAKYPATSGVAVVGGFVLAALGSVAVFDGVTQRIAEFSERLVSTSRFRQALIPILILGGSIVSSLLLSAIGPPSPPAQVAVDVAAEPTPVERPIRIDLEPVAIESRDAPASMPGLRLQAITTAGMLKLPTFLASPPDDDRLFVIERSGRMSLVDGGDAVDDPIIDISADVSTAGDGGLLGLAFHPGFAHNGRVLLLYNDSNYDSKLVEFVLDPATAIRLNIPPREILSIPQPDRQHAGGTIQFGPDGLLYLSIGDGGLFGDPDGHAQNADSLLGSILRIDVDHGSPYSIPDGNPFGNEVFALGLRNPYRFWIDPSTRQMIIGDAGQFYWEEINGLELSEVGINFGWVTTEGPNCFLGEKGWLSTCDRRGIRFPILEYQNVSGFTNRAPDSAGCAVIAGPTYRGSAIPDLRGWTLVADFCRNWILGLDIHGDSVRQIARWSPTEGATLGTVLSFGEDASGEIYLLTSADGLVYRFESADSA